MTRLVDCCAFVRLAFLMTLACLGATCANATDSLVLRHERSGGSFLWGIAQGDRRLVAVGSEGTVLTSMDGQNWQRIAAGAADALMAVAYGGGRFVAVGANGTILISEHGTQWSRASASGTTERLNNVIWSEGLYVAVGEHGVIVTSEDAEVWTARPSGKTGWLRGLVAYPAGGYTTAWSGGATITVSYPKFLAAGESGSSVASLDGIDWSLKHRPLEYWSGPDVEALMLGEPGEFFAAGADGLVTHIGVFGGGTAPPIWTSRSNAVGGNSRLRGCVLAGGQLYAFGEKGTVLSSLSFYQPWTTLASHTDANLTAGVSIGNSFYVVGENETILQSVRTDSSRLVNLSSRGFAGRDDSTLISGFVVQGSRPKRVLLRAVGPGLTRLAGISGVIEAPQITLLDSSRHEMASNAGWTNANNADEIVRLAGQIGAFPLATADRDAALLVTLDPGLYTTTVSPQNGATGLCLVEAYDADDPNSSDAKAINISTRAFVGIGDNLLIAGFVIGGESARSLLIRGVGPALKSRFGMSGVLERPQLKLVDSHGLVVATAEAWSSTTQVDAIRAAANRVGAFDFDEGSNDSALLVTLHPGVYTALVSSVDGGSGTALVEVYDLP